MDYALKSRPKNAAGHIVWGTVGFFTDESEARARLACGNLDPTQEYAIFSCGFFGPGKMVDGPYDGRTLEPLRQEEMEL